MLNNSRGSALICIISLAIILNLVFAAVYFSIETTQAASGDRRLNTSAMALAESGKEKLYGQINKGTFVPTAGTRVNVFSNYSLGKGSFSVSCSSNAALDTIWVESWGKEGLSEAGIAVLASITSDAAVNAGNVNAAVTSRPDVELKGTITIDGRDHDSSGVLIPGAAGVYGVSTCGTLDIGSSAQVGGNGFAWAVKKSSTSDINKVSVQKVPVSPVLQSPEAFLGVPAGSLDKYIVKSGSSPVIPFHGIQYITTSIGPLHLGNSSGILIVHNSTAKNAELHLNGGIFKGLIIIDQMDKLNGGANVIGAVVALSDDSGAPKFGNGNSSVLYSSYVMNHLKDFCGAVSRKANELSWRELRK